jgi:hypothetical protein
MMRRQEVGIASLLALLVLVTLAAAWLSTALGTRAHAQTRRSAATQTALAEAREALLGYAVRYPDVPGVAATGGPGRLPCPDLRNDTGEPAGTADAPCASRTGTALGRLPWHTLGLPDLRDGSGAPLFYAVSDAFRSHLSGPVNNETGATLGLDACAGESAVVAVVFAPGEALSGQQRGPQATAADFLEGINATPGTRCFSTRRDAHHNDVLLPLTRADLMRLSERRVRGEVAASLRRYRRAHGPYPWLASADSPEFRGSIGVALGRLALRLPDAAGADPLQVRNAPGAFEAAFRLSWSMPTGGVLEQSGDRPPPPACVRTSTCDAGSDARIGPATPAWTEGRCKAQRPRMLACELALDTHSTRQTLVRRRYSVVLDGWPHTLLPPAQTRSRTQHFQAASRRLATTPRAERLQISVRDFLVDDRNVETLQGESRLTLSPGEWLEHFALLDVPFDLEVGGEETLPATANQGGSPGALPYWFMANRWHPQIRLGYARANAPGAANLACTRHTAGCLTVIRLRDAARNALQAEAVIVSGGAPLGLQGQRRPSERGEDYFEGTNAFAVGAEAPVFEARLDAVDFNDGLRLVAPHE